MAGSVDGSRSTLETLPIMHCRNYDTHDNTHTHTVAIEILAMYLAMNICHLRRDGSVTESVGRAEIPHECSDCITKLYTPLLLDNYQDI